MLSIGIDIGRYSVKVALIEGSPKNFQVVGLDEFPLGQDPAKDQTFDVLEALREIKKRYTAEGAPVVVAARQNHLSLRRRSFPFKERHKILKSLPFELEDDIPLSFESAVFEAKITHFSEGQAQVLALVCPNTHIQQILSKTGDAAIEPDIVSAEAVAISNLFETLQDAPVEIAGTGDALPEAVPADLVLHIGHTETIGIVLRDGYMLDAVVLDWGGKDLAEMIALKYGIHYVEALKELRKKGFLLLNSEGASREQLALSDVLKSALGEFASVLRLSVLEIQTQHGVRIQKASLCGGVAGLRNLGPFMTQKLEIPVNRITALPALQGLDFVKNPKNEMAHIVSIGLAVEGLKRPKNPPVNFLKGAYARQSETLRVFWEKWSPTIRVAAGLFAVFLFWSFFRESFSVDMLSSANARLKDHAKNVANLTGRQASNRNIRRYVRDQELKIKQREVFENLQDISSALDVLNKVSKASPAKTAGALNVTQLAVNNTELRVAGYADKAELVTQFQNSLKAVAADGNVQVLNPQGQVPAGARGFLFAIKLDRQSGG